ncbi:MAG: hypothetical protein GEU80_07425 [Dehalococcoidia bacterium]|nr:hypothetical protein [Dehalococcoidia bacterium]
MTDRSYWTSRLGRRGLLRGGALLSAGVGAAALIGCGGDDEGDGDGGSSGSPAASDGSGATSPAPSGAAQGDHYGGTYRRFTTLIESNFDVYMTQGSSDLFSHISERLLRIDPSTLELQPGLISEWEEIEAGMEYVLHIHPEAVWENKAPTNGRAFDAEDVVWNILYAGEYEGPEHTAQRASWYFGIENAEAVDDKTVRLTLSEPNGPVLAAMADHRQHMVPKEVPESYGWDNYPNFPAIGPFRMTSYDPGTVGTFERNPDYVLTGANGDALPYFDGVELNWFGDNASAYAAFLTDQLDVMPVTPSDAKDLDDESGVTVYRLPFRGTQLQVLNTERYADVRVRKAFHNLLDYQDIGENVHLGDYKWSGKINQQYPYVMKEDEVRVLPGFNPDTREADVAEAFKLLDAAGFPEGAGLVFNNVSSATTGNAFDWQIRIQGQLAQVAPAIEYNTNTPTDGPSFQRALLAGEHDCITHQSYDGPETRLAIQAFATGHSRNWSKYSNPTVDELVARSMAESGEQLGETIAELEAILMEDHPWFGLGIVPALAARDRVQGIDRGGWEGASGNDSKIVSQYYWFTEDA